MVRIDDVMDEDYSEINEELATLTEETNALTTPVKGKRSRPSSRRGKTQTTVHSTAAKTRRQSKYKPNITEKFKTTSSGTGYATLCATSTKKLEEYKSRQLEPMEQEKANEHMKSFEDTKTKKLPEELNNPTDPQFKHWVDHVLKDNRRFPCITPMTKFRTPETEPLKSEDKDHVVGPPPRRTYRFQKLYKDN